ncbi:MAG: phage tail tape measure protein [Azoarcus sp.]|jgi:TP901 family phage tail tape measure protein|nr:phage tail tape measure protein [Azoarcus sp.]
MTTLSTSIKIGVDADSGKDNLRAFMNEWMRAQKSLGESPKRIGMLEMLARQVREGRKALAEIPAEYRDVVAELNRGIQFNSARDLLGVRSHAGVAAEIDKVRAAYEAVARSGEATWQESAQAALKAEMSIRGLAEETGGWVTALSQAKMAFAGLAAQAAGIRYAIGAAMSFEAGMAGVAKVVDGTDAQIEALGERLKELAQAMPIEGGLSGLTRIAQAGGQMGIPIEDMEKFIRLTAEMSAAFGMTAADAGDAVARMMNVYAVPLGEVEALADSINGLGNTMATNERSIVETMTRIGGSARAFGLLEREAAALSATMNALGMSPQVAATAIGGLLDRLQTLSSLGEDAHDALARMGLSATQLAADIREKPQAALLSFLASLRKLDGAARTDVLVKVFGRENAGEIARLSLGLEQYRAALQKVGDTANLTGAMHAEFLRQLETSDNRLQVMKQGFETLGAEIGKNLLPLFDTLVQTLGGAAQAIAWLVREFPTLSTLSGGILLAVTSAGALRLAFLALRVAGGQLFAATITGFKTMIAQMTGATAGMTAMARAAATARAGMALMGGPIGVAIVAVTALHTAFTNLGKAGAEAAEKIAGRLEDLKRPMEEVREAFLKLSEAQRIKDLADRRKEIDSLTESYRAQATEIERTGVKGANYTGRLADDARAAFRMVAEEAAKVGTAVPANWDRAAEAVANAGGMANHVRERLLALIVEAQKTQQSVRGLIGVVTDLEGVAKGAAAGIDAMTSSLSSGTVAAQKAIGELKTKIADLRDPRPEGRFDRNILPGLIQDGADRQAIDEYRRLFVERERLEEAARKAKGREKRDPVREANLSKERELVRQLAEANRQLERAQAGVFDSATRQRDALEIWLATDNHASKLSEEEKEARRRQADAVDAAAKAYSNLAEAKKRAEEIKTAMNGVEIELFRLDGRTVEAARREFMEKYKELVKNLQAEIAAGNTDAQAQLDLVVKLEGIEAAQARLDGILAQIEKIRDAQGRDESSLQTEIDTGLLTEVEGRERLLDIHRRTHTELERMRPLLAELAQMPGAVGEQARIALQQLEDQQKQLLATTTMLQSALKEGLTAGLTEALTGLAKGTMDLRDAVTALGQAVLDAMLKMAIEGLAQQATNGIMGLIGNLTGAGADKGADKTAEAAAVTSLSTAASGLTGATGSLTQAVVGLTTAANAFASASGGGLAASGNALAGLSNGGNANAGSAAGGEGAGALTGAGALLANAAGQLLGAGSSLAGAGGDLSSGGSALSAVATLLTTAASLLMTASGAETTSGIVSAVGAVAGAAAADGGLISGFSPSERADNIPAWLTAGEFVTRRRVMRQPGALAFMESFNRRGMDAVRAWAKCMRLPGYADGGPVLPAPPSMPDRTAILRGWEPAQAGGNATPVTNRIGVYTYFDLDQMNAALAKSRDFEKIVVKVAQTNGMAIQRSWQ